MRKYKIGDEILLDTYGEICCELCDEIIHNHINCPICDSIYASTGNYRSLYELEKDENIICECGTEYRIISKDCYPDPKVIIIKLGKK